MYIKTHIYFWSYLTNFFLEREMFQTKVVQQTKTHFSCSVTFIAEPDTLQTTKRLMCIECWIPKATNTLPGYVTLTAFLLQQWLYECTSMLRYTCIACRVQIATIALQEKSVYNSLIKNVRNGALSRDHCTISKLSFFIFSPVYYKTYYSL